ncbi:MULTISPECIES: IS200/IS605 family transposase [Wolbachia]|uniref:IS200/IS605 family transposase n=1 Tax=Wolbachia TaxID=953 RepID=UPI001E62E946|nr:MULTISPECIES: IS200/IS605 family transposase [unclassified Wolbachia]UFO00284.1 IS200/IS605 family transposase [Wolbachia endosymbiont of Corcyra cephalonica]
MTEYDKGKHTVFYHRYHIVWITKYRYRVLTKAMKERIRTIIAEVSEEMEIKIENGVISSDHLHLFVVIPPHIAVSDFVQRAKGRSSRKVQQEFPELNKMYWGKRFWGRGYFSATSGHITDKVINEYINKHTDAHQPHSISSIRLE